MTEVHVISRPHVLVLCALACTCFAWGEEAVLTKDGRLVRGAIRQVASALKVEAPTPRRDVYLSPGVVSERLAVAATSKQEAEFRFHEDSAKERRKGTIAPVVEDFRWGSWDPDGSATLSLKDPALGDVTFRVVVTRVTPDLTELQGVEYTWVRSFPTATLASLVLPMIERQVREAPTADGWLQLAAFHRLRGDAGSAERALEEARRSGADEAACAAEREALAIGAFLDRLDELHGWMATGREEDALRDAALLEVPPSLEKSDPLRYRQAVARLAALKARTERHREALDQLAKRALPFLSLSPVQADRLERVLRQGPERVDERFLPALCQEWAEGFASAKWNEAALPEAIELAEALASPIPTQDRDAVAKLAAQLTASKLPTEVKLSLLRHTARFPEPPAEAVGGWHRVEHRPPDANRTFHYCLSVPAGYRPDAATPVLIALHGQHGKAEDMNRVWGRHAAREGWILISPEYIYGRKWGYLFSQEEHQAVLGALRDAAGYLNIDADRVFLTGHSQGGHAAWDIGPAHAGVFAAVIPIIGAPLSPAHWPNFRDTALYAIDGSQDGLAPQMNRRAIQDLARMRTDATYVEYVNRGHEGFGEEYDAVCAWLRTKRRARTPDVNLVAFRGVESRRRWVEVLATRTPLPERLEGALSPVTVEGRLLPNNRIELKTANVTRLRVLIAPEAFDPDQPVSIRLNGRHAWRGIARPDWGLTLRECLARRDLRDLFIAEVLLDVR